MIERHGLIINNNEYQATRSGNNCRSIIDLTLSTSSAGALAKWEIDESLATTSDHEVIVFEWTPLNAVILKGEKEGAQNWDLDRLYADEHALEAARENWLELSEGRVLIDAWAT